MSRGLGQTQRTLHRALVIARREAKLQGDSEGWLSTNALVDLAYPDPVDRERHRFAVRKAMLGLSRPTWDARVAANGVTFLVEGVGPDERWRAELAGWDGRHLPTPRKRRSRPTKPAVSGVRPRCAACPGCLDSVRKVCRLPR